MTALGVLAFVVGLIVSIMLHEAGHLVTAKRFGMKATEYFVGFGPRLVSWRRGETEYGAKAIPAGGYVKIIGMGQEEDIPPEDQDRAFHRQPAWQRGIVLVSGSVIHFLIALVLLFIIAVGLGLPGPSLTVGEVVPCVQQGSDTECTAQSPPSPAVEAGLRTGDRVVAFEGRPVDSWQQLTGALERHGAGAATVTVVRDGERRTLDVDLASRDGGGFLGMAPAADAQRMGPLDGLAFTGQSFGSIVAATARVFAAIPAAIPDLFSEERGSGSPGSGVASVVGVARISGDVFTGDQSWSLRLIVFLSLMVSVNISVGILNLLPLMPLDGGRLAVLGYESARSRLARIRGRVDPGPVDLNKLLPATSLVIVLLVSFGVLLILADIFNPVALS